MRENRIQLEKKIKAEGLKKGTISSVLDNISKKELSKVLDGITGDSTDILIKYRNKKYIVEITVVDNEIDFSTMTFKEYIDRYGEEYLDKFED